MTRDEWLRRFAEAAGTDAPDPHEIETLLDIAGVAARASERMAAPLTCWMVARAGMDVDRAMEIARSLADEPPEI